MTKESVDSLQKYINQIELDLDIGSSFEQLGSLVEEILIFLKYAYGTEISDLFYSLEVDENDLEGSMRKVRAFLLALANKNTPKNRSSNSKSSFENIKKEEVQSNAVFIVHGHDNEAKETVARFVAKLGLEPIILHERPNNGKTIIEKLENNSEEASFAIVLLTPDDVGSSMTSVALEPRARQNVIYELGFFNAKLGRDKVCVLKKGEIELLSDYLGVVYVDMDKNGGWKNQLVREIKQAGLRVSSEGIEKALLT